MTFGPKPRPIEERFWEKVPQRVNGECWIWRGEINRKGYGNLFLRRGPRRSMLAHRLSYEMAYGAIPEKMFVCHRCDTPPCVNPEHLFLGTNADNMRDASEKGRIKGHNSRKTHCAHGHPFAGDNLVRLKNGKRACRTCSNVHSRRHKAAKRLEATL